MKRFALTIDHDACWGCRTCEVACKQECNAPDGIRLIAILEDGPRPLDGRLYFSFTVAVCRHCDDPHCVPACPEQAIRQREDGLVLLDPETCTGCGLCVPACPYGAIVFDGEKGIARKCNLCHHRVDRGLLPACADNVCLAHCIRFEERPGDTRRPVAVTATAP